MNNRVEFKNSEKPCFTFKNTEIAHHNGTNGNTHFFLRRSYFLLYVLKLENPTIYYAITHTSYLNQIQMFPLRTLQNNT
jgi:hypothetical protein